MGSDRRHTIRNRHARETGAVLECPRINRSNRQALDPTRNHQRPRSRGTAAGDHHPTSTHHISKQTRRSQRKKYPRRTLSKRRAPTRLPLDVIDGGWSIQERIVSGGRCIPPEKHARQTSALPERINADGGEAAGEGHARQTFAPIERPVADGGEAVGEGHARQAFALRERPVEDGGDAVGDVVIARFRGGIIEKRGLRVVEQYPVVAAKSTVSDIHRETRHASAPRERLVADGGDAAGEGHAR